MTIPPHLMLKGTIKYFEDTAQHPTLGFFLLRTRAQETVMASATAKPKDHVVKASSHLSVPRGGPVVDQATHIWHPFPNVPKHQFKPLKFRTTLPQEIRQNEEFQLMDCIENRAEYNSTANVDRSNTPQGLIKQALFFFLMGGQVHTFVPQSNFF